jgi:hypothetical protein
VPNDLESAIAESARLAPGLEDAVSTPDGWHYTATVDLEYVIKAAPATSARPREPGSYPVATMVDLLVEGVPNRASDGRGHGERRREAVHDPRM